MNKLIGLMGAAVLALSFNTSAADAASVGPGDLCGNKYIGLTQDGMILSPSICETGNSTGGGTVYPTWQGGAETGSGAGDDDGKFSDGNLILTITGSNWEIENPFGYEALAITVKQGNGYALFELDLAKALSGMFATGNNESPTGNDYSHINAWYQGDPTCDDGDGCEPPVTFVPVPAGLPLVLSGLGIIGILRARKRKSA